MDVFGKKYKGAVPLQTGNFFVAATALNEEGKQVGGGLIADFNKYPDALKCAQEIHDLDPNHEPEIWEWTNNHQDCERVERMTASTSERAEKVLAAKEDDEEKPFAPAQYLVF